MKFAFVDKLEKDQEVTDFFRVAMSQVRETKSGKPYMVIGLVDKTGELDCRLWDIPQDLDSSSIAEGAFVKVRGRVSEYRDKLQMSIMQIRLAAEGEFDRGDFFRRSERDPDEMWRELSTLADDWLRDNWGNVTPLWDLVTGIMQKFCADYVQAPAGKSVHHAYIGGLLEHVLSLTHMAEKVAKHYGLRRDLMVATCILHDLGKLWELSPEGSYTVPGTLLGHICLGMQVISEEASKIENFPDQLKVEVLHCVAAHHGLLEYGSPKIPLMREAIAFHLLDMLDSRQAICAELMLKKTGDENFTEWSNALGGPLYRGVDRVEA